MSAKETVASKETITGKISRWASGLEYKQLSQDAVYQAKRFLLDSVGCALGGYQQHDVKIALEVLDEIAGRGPATVVGTGKKLDAVSASLANALMIRCMDYNDIYWKQDPSHPSDIFPAALACCERAKSDGRELIVGLVLGHEFEMRFCEAAFPGIRERGWHHATLTAFVSPIVAGRALHLDWEQIQHAIGISGSRHCTLGAVTAGKLTMMKNTVDPMATQSGVFAALLAKVATGDPSVLPAQPGKGPADPARRRLCLRRPPRGWNGWKHRSMRSQSRSSGYRRDNVSSPSFSPRASRRQCLAPASALRRPSAGASPRRKQVWGWHR